MYEARERETDKNEVFLQKEGRDISNMANIKKKEKLRKKEKR